MPQHGNTVPQGDAIELAAIRGGSVDQPATQQVDPLHQPLEDQLPVLLEEPRVGRELLYRVPPANGILGGAVSQSKATSSGVSP